MDYALHSMTLFRLRIVSYTLGMEHAILEVSNK